jgi:hypothetical protein
MKCASRGKIVCMSLTNYSLKVIFKIQFWNIKLTGSPV